MAIIDRLNRWQFMDEFNKRRPHNFSHAGLHTLFDYLEQLSENMGSDIEFDPISLCCDFAEYDTFKQFQADYDYIESMEDLQRHTTVIPIEEEDGFLIEKF